MRRKASERGVPERSIEHNYCLSWLLIAIGSDDFLLERLVLKGGTCLRKVYFPEWRYSDDLDFTAFRSVELARLVEGLARACSTLRDEAGIYARVEMVPPDPGQTVSCEVAYVGPLQRTGQPGRIKIDISLDEIVLTSPVLRGILL
ncbi:MAG: nucleotidyl transferase AbiEii/AbiGii toxin family protein, partial [Bacillota bacterium]|nr:nucleotidyl transferase AbiEii/AbiGii toxin family protein [Bacillota bacterium]